MHSPCWNNRFVCFPSQQHNQLPWCPGAKEPACPPSPCAVVCQVAFCGVVLPPVIFPFSLSRFFGPPRQCYSAGTPYATFSGLPPPLPCCDLMPGKHQKKTVQKTPNTPAGWQFLANICKKIPQKGLGQGLGLSFHRIFAQAKRFGDGKWG